MKNKVNNLVNVILESYNKYDITARIDEENIVNKDILIKVLEEIRKLPECLFLLRKVRIPQTVILYHSSVSILSL